MQEDPFTGLRARFVDRSRAQLAELRRLSGCSGRIAEDRREAVAWLAHALAGSSGSFGFPEVSARAAELEALVSQEDDLHDDNVALACRELIEALQRIEV